MFNLQTLFNAIDQSKKNPHLAAISPQIAQQYNNTQFAPVGEGAAAVAPQLGSPADTQPVPQGLGWQVPQLGTQQEVQPAAPQMPSQNLGWQVPTLDQMQTTSAVEQPVPPADGSLEQAYNKQLEESANFVPPPPPPAPVAPILPQSMQTAKQIQEIQSKDYGNRKNADGSLYRDKDGNVEHGKNRNKKWSTLEKVGSTLLGGLVGYSQGGLGGAIAGAIQGGTNRNYQSQMSDRKMLAGLAPQMEQQQKNEQFNMDQAGKQSRINDTVADNAERVRQFNERQKATEASKLEQGKQTFIKRTFGNGKRFDPAQMSAYDKEQAKLYNINPDELKAFDFSKPLTKEINGTTYKYNDTTGSFEETNLPKNGSKELVDFEVQMPGEPKPRTFKVSQDRAASFTTQMRAAGINAELAEKRFEYQKEKDSTDRSDRRTEFIKNFNFKVEQDAKTGAFKKIDQLREIEKDKAEGKIDQETYNQMKAVIDRF